MPNIPHPRHHLDKSRTPIIDLKTTRMKKFRSLTSTIQADIITKMHIPIVREIKSTYRLFLYQGENKEIVDFLYPVTEQRLLDNMAIIFKPDFNSYLPSICIMRQSSPMPTWLSVHYPEL